MPRLTLPTAVLIALGLVSCTAESERIPCGEAQYAIRDALDAEWEDPNGCASDCDCTMAPVEIRCAGGTQLWLCPEPVHVDSVDDFEDFLHDVEDDLCSRVGEGCFGGPGCVPRVGACVDGRCTAVEAPESVDAGSADAGAADACVPSS